MLKKFKNSSFGYKLWALSVALSAIYFLVKFFFFEPSAFDRFIEAYALVSLLIDYLFVDIT